MLQHTGYLHSHPHGSARTVLVVATCIAVASIETTTAVAAGPAGPAGSILKARAPQLSVTVPGVPRFINYPSPYGDNAGEPSIGINWNTEQTFSNSAGPIPNGGTSLYFGGFMPYMAKVVFNDCHSPAEATWTKKPLITASTTRAFGDPILFTDRTTGRTFVCQLEGLTPAGSTVDYTDDDGDTFTPVAPPAGAPSCIDHETIGGGIFHAPLTTGIGYANAVYYASQCVADATSSLSLDGGRTYLPNVPMFTVLDCDGLHGHIKVAPNDGTVYVPDKECAITGVPLVLGGRASVIVSDNNGTTWTIRPVDSPLAATKGDDDPSVGVATDGTVYLGWQSSDGHPRIAVSHDKGATWVNIRDVGLSLGVQNCVFPEVAAGDPDRAAFAFFGTTTGGSNYDQPEFTGDWYLYIATTFDGGNTWTTVNATPGDPIQHNSGICGDGQCRNLLDFFDMAIDKEGRIVVGSEDGCIGSCVSGGANSFTAAAVICRQSGGKRMLAAYDPVEPRVAEAPAGSGIGTGAAVALSWQAPDNGGSDITGYRVYRVVNGGPPTLLSTQTGTTYDDVVNPADDNAYAVTALNAMGEGPYCLFRPTLGGGPSACALPGLLPNDDLNADGTDNDGGVNTPPDPSVNVRQLFLAEPYALGAGGAAIANNELVFTMRMAPGGTLTPSSQWYIIWNRKVAATDGSDRRFVAMKTDATNALSFVYGDFGPPLDATNPQPNANTPLVLGNADFGSFDPATGVMTIKLARSNLDEGGLAPGSTLAALNVRTYLARPDAGQKSQNNASDITANGSYTLVGNASCFCTVDQAPVAGLTAAPTSGVAPLVVHFDASSSLDPDAVDGDGVASYTFTFADGTPPVTQASPLIDHTYGVASGPSGFFATVAVTDSKCGKPSAGPAFVNIDVNPATTAVSLSLLSAKAEPGRVALTWFSRQITSATVYRMKSGDSEWQAIGQATIDDAGMLNYVDTRVSPETRYGYKLQIGPGEFSQEAWIVVPSAQFALRPLGNPSKDQVALSLALDRDGTVRVQVFSASTGHRVADLANAWMPAGTHRLQWSGRDVAGNLAPVGIYVVRAMAHGHDVMARVTLVR